MVNKSVLIYFNRLGREHAVKASCVVFETDDLEVCSVLIFL